ncbi:MAG: M14 family metallopeptidase [Bacteroidetes bacterium]|nr:M14 family metallopeptidase [Bacteroidota bacterium]
MKNKILSLLFLLVAFAGASAQESKNTLYDGGSPSIPKPVFGQYTVGDDYFLANYQQFLQYLDQVAKVSDRIKIEDIGKTTEGRPFKLIIISSPENLANLERYRQISVKLARAEGLTDDEAQKLASEGKAVVWIDGGLHATECINAQGLFIHIYGMLARNDEETMRILDNVILLMAAVNPDGMDLVSNWYMQESDPLKRNMNIPTLYQKYVGHDNNRDSYLASQVETEIINRQMFIEWIPQIMYNQHQTGPSGTVLFIAPFRDPFNYNYDPLVPIGIDLVGTAVHLRFLAEGKGGAVKREEASYSTWFNGGVRTTVGFHNQIGILHEIVGNPTPITIPLVANKLLPYGNNPLPIGPHQVWHQYQSLEYVISANRAILDLAAREKEVFLYRIYRAGKNSIERGSQDYWTLTPKWIDRLNANIDKYRKENPDSAPAGNAFGGGRAQNVPVELYDQLFTPENRDPRGYIFPANQEDFITATRFIHALQKTGVDIHRATQDFTVAGKSYPAGSYIVKAAQAFRPHLRDMIEPQDHPNDFQYPGGPPIPPYDVAGYTLAFQMGVQFDSILDEFDGPFEKMEGLAKIPAGKISGASAPAGYLLSHQVNDAFVATTRLLAAGEEVYWLQAPLTAGAKTWPTGTIYIRAKGSTAVLVQKLANELGLNFTGISSKPTGNAWKLRPVKVALCDQYGGSMPSGWIRWILEQQFPFSSFEVVYPQMLDAGNLHAKYDVIILPPGAFPARAGGSGQTRTYDNIPAEYRDRLGSITLDKTAPQLRKFVEDGGTVLAIGSSTEFGRWLGLPIANALSEIQGDGTERPFNAEKFYIPGSVLRVKVNNTTPIAYGLPEDLDIMFGNNPVFRLKPEAGQKGLYPVAWFPNAEPLRSGWAWGQHYLNGGTVMAEAKVGKGNVFLFGNEITFRAQPHGTFKFLFNGIYYSGAVSVKL